LKTYADILLHIPVDSTLRTYLEKQGMELPPDFEWADNTETSHRLIELIAEYQDSAVRDKVIAGLKVSAKLDSPKGREIMQQVCAFDATTLVDLIACQSELHRAFWLSVHHPKLFEAAAENEFLESHIQQAQQHELGTHAQIRHGQTSIEAFCSAIKTFYKNELGCGEACVVNILNRTKGTQLVSVHAKDLASMKLEFEGDNLTRRVGSPNIHMVLEYAAATGVARTIIRGGAKYHDMLAHSFAEHLLGVKVTAKRIKLPTLDLSSLRLGFQVPEAVEDGFVSLQVKSITLMSPNATLKSEFTAMASSDHQCVTDLIADSFPNDNPLTRQWLVSAAKINLEYAPEPGKQRGKVLTVEVTRRGRLNLHKYDDKLRAQLEGYLVQIGVMASNQTLSVDIKEPPIAEAEAAELIDQ
jgi:hypothetical protein